MRDRIFSVGLKPSANFEGSSPSSHSVRWRLWEGESKSVQHHHQGRTRMDSRITCQKSIRGRDGAPTVWLNPSWDNLLVNLYGTCSGYVRCHPDGPDASRYGVGTSTTDDQSIHLLMEAAEEQSTDADADGGSTSTSSSLNINPMTNTIVETAEQLRFYCIECRWKQQPRKLPTSFWMTEEVFMYYVACCE